MALCLRQVNTRLLKFNPSLINGKRQISSSTTFDRHFCPKDINTFKPQPYSHILNKKLCFGYECMIPRGSVAYCNQPSSNNPSPGNEIPKEKLEYVYENLKQHIPQFFVAALDYSICDKDIIFENRIRGKTYKGLLDYVKQMSFLRLYGHVKFAYVKMEVLKMTMHPEDSTVKIRWRISGITGYRLAFKMIQFRVWRPREMVEKHQSTWIDGFSTFYVNQDGFIVRHIADKMMPDEDRKLNPIEKVVDKLGGIPKLAIFVKLSTDLTPCIT